MNTFAQKTKRAAGFTLIELLVVVSIIALLIGILLPALGRARKQAQQLTCGTQVREMQRGLINFAQDNNENYPIPSTLDRLNNTENIGGTAGQPSTNVNLSQQIKNRSGAIMSILIFEGQVVPQMAVTPAEVDGAIRPDSNFQTGQPGIAANPALALWDPAFVGTRDQQDGMWQLPNSGQIGQGTRKDDITSAGAGSNFSYAHIPVMSGQRLQFWRSSFSASEVVIGNRGPVYVESTTSGGGSGQRLSQTWQLIGTPATGGSAGANPLALMGFQSPTLLIHGGKREWAGNLGYNDNHVEFSNTPTPQNVRISYLGDSNGTEEQVPDNVFFDEQWEVNEGALTPSGRSNVYLRQWAQSIGQGNLGTIQSSGQFPGDWQGNAPTWDGKTSWGFGN